MRAREGASGPWSEGCEEQRERDAQRSEHARILRLVVCCLLVLLLVMCACPQSVCGSFADKYVEYELILVALDLLLLKVQVYRHCLFNLSSAGLKVRSNTADEHAAPAPAMHSRLVCSCAHG